MAIYCIRKGKVGEKKKNTERVRVRGINGERAKMRRDRGGVRYFFSYKLNKKNLYKIRHDSSSRSKIE